MRRTACAAIAAIGVIPGASPGFDASITDVARAARGGPTPLSIVVAALVVTATALLLALWGKR